MPKYKLIGEKEGNPTIVEMMPEVKKDQGGFTQFDHDLFHKALASRGIHKVPKNIYQVMYDMAPRSNDPLEHKVCSERTRKYLDKWVQDTFPTYKLINFIDLSTEEARALHPSLTWGMYVQLVQFISEKPMELNLPDITKEMKLLCNTVQNTKQLGL